MDYQQALDYIYSFVDYGLKSRYKYSSEIFDLTRMRNLLARLGDPQLRIPAVHVAGTKGKGSVSAMIASILRAAGYRVGLYTSPHLNDFCERIQLDGQPIPAESLAALTADLRPLFDSTPGITTFEIATALAHEWFARQTADFAVIEVGLGGRLDATNMVMPVVCAITSISYDHTQLLGSTLAEIAEEKAGIIKPGVPVVSSPQAVEALERITAIAAERGTRVRVVGCDWKFERESFALSGQTFAITQLPEGFDPWTPRHFEIPLLGAYQVDNAMVAIALAAEMHVQGFDISSDSVQRGLQSVKWPGRFEIIEDEANGKTFILDCAHNRDSAAKLVSALRETFPNARPALIFGASNDKDIAGMLVELLPAASRVIFSRADHPRASGSAELAELARSIGVAHSAKVAHTVSGALDDARQGPDSLVLVTGSIFLVADVRALLLQI